MCKDIRKRNTSLGKDQWLNWLAGRFSTTGSCTESKSAPLSLLTSSSRKIAGTSPKIIVIHVKMHETLQAFKCLFYMCITELTVLQDQNFWCHIFTWRLTWMKFVLLFLSSKYLALEKIPSGISDSPLPEHWTTLKKDEKNETAIVISKIRAS